MLIMSTMTRRLAVYDINFISIWHHPNYLDRVFIRISNRRIFREDYSLCFDSGTKTQIRDFVLMIAGKIHALLKDSDDVVETLNNVQ
jgi:hypothetical protein